MLSARTLSSLPPIDTSSSRSPLTSILTLPCGTRDLTRIIAAHNIPYAAQSTFTKDFKDLHLKAEKAIYTEGPCFLNVLSPCPRGWRYETADIAEICDLAVETCVWPLYEIENGVWKLTYEPKKKLPVEDFLKKQGRFAHMFRSGSEWIIEETQEYIDDQWEKLLKRCE